MNKDLLKTVIADQDYYFEQAKGSVKREFADNFRNSPEIVIITGIRRCGKSTLLQQIRAAQTEKDYCILNSGNALCAVCTTQATRFSLQAQTLEC